MTEDMATHTADVRAYDAWCRAHAAVRTPIPKIGEMVAVMEEDCVRLSSQIGAVSVLTGNPYSREQMRRLVVMEAAVELLLRIKAHAAEWPTKVQTIIRGGE